MLYQIEIDVPDNNLVSIKEFLKSVSLIKRFEPTIVVEDPDTDYHFSKEEIADILEAEKQFERGEGVICDTYEDAVRHLKSL
ncbi:MAG: hypothetical protein LBQ31_08110 [Bacteroidales bacterium]|jgi:hypothetical protein|nr:hypothetical protein [Bacteroidales bacterium]